MNIKVILKTSPEFLSASFSSYEDLSFTHPSNLVKI